MLNIYIRLFIPTEVIALVIIFINICSTKGDISYGI